MSSAREKGTVKWFDAKKGFGFIQREGGKGDAFVHFKSILGSGYRSLTEGELVEFNTEQGPKGIQATEVQRQNA